MNGFLIVAFLISGCLCAQEKKISSNGQPDFSGDGKRIAFTSERDGNPEIYIMNSDGTGAKRITNNPARDIAPVWSPDGEMIAFISNRKDSTPDLYIIKIKSETATQLTSNMKVQARIDWSPDGKWIGFSSRITGNEEVYVVKSDGSGQPERITNDSASDGSICWVKKTGRIAFHSGRNNKILHVFTMNKDGSEIRQVRLVSDTLSDYVPSYSADGNLIAFASHGDINNENRNNFEIYLMNSDGSNVRNITLHPGYDFWLSISPAGDKIVFQSRREGNIMQVFLIDIKTGDTKKLTE